MSYKILKSDAWQDILIGNPNAPEIRKWTQSWETRMVIVSVVGSGVLLLLMLVVVLLLSFFGKRTVWIDHLLSLETGFCFFWNIFEIQKKISTCGGRERPPAASRPLPTSVWCSSRSMRTTFQRPAYLTPHPTVYIQRNLVPIHLTSSCL